MSVTDVQDRNLLHDISKNYNNHSLEWMSYREDSLIDTSYSIGRISYHGEIYLTFNNQWCYDANLWKYSSSVKEFELYPKAYSYTHCHNLYQISNTIYNRIMHEVYTNADYPNEFI